MTISQQAADVRGRLQQGKIGERVFVTPLDRILSALNSDPQAFEVRTVVFTGTTNDHTYSVVINGTTVSYLSDASASLIEEADGMAAAINAEALVRGQVAAVSDGVDTVTITGLLAGVAFTLTEADAQITIALVTAAAEADAIAFGRLCVFNGFDAAEDNDKLCGLAKAALMADQVDTWVMVYDALVVAKCTIVIEGETYSASIVQAAASDEDTEYALLVAEINTALPADTVIATYVAGTDSIVLTAEVEGKAFSSQISFAPPIGATVDTGSATKTSTAGIDADINLADLGVSLYAFDEEITTVAGTSASYPANAGVRLLKKGVLWVDNSQSVANGEPVYVELGVVADNGKFFNSSSATRLLLSGARWERAGISGDGINAIAIDL